MPTICHELLIGVAPEKLYAAITTPEGLAAWWTPAAEARTEQGSIARFPFGPGYYKEMKVVELVSSKLVKWTCIKGASEWVGTTITFRLEPFDKNNLLDRHPEMEGQLQQQRNKNTGTLLIFNHDDWKDYSPMFAECNYTWGRFLRSLKLFCEMGVGHPWPEQHGIQ